VEGRIAEIEQYFLHAEMCENWGYGRMAAHTRDESIEEMQHAEKLMERILPLDGIPNMSYYRESRPACRPGTTARSNL
jgi:bacterioferritin